MGIPGYGLWVMGNFGFNKKNAFRKESILSIKCKAAIF